MHFLRPLVTLSIAASLAYAEAADSVSQEPSSLPPAEIVPEDIPEVSSSDPLSDSSSAASVEPAVEAVESSSLTANVEAISGPRTIGGDISGFLKTSESPYVVTETLVLREGKALVIEAGVQLRFNPGTGLDIQGGSLTVVGEKNAPVVFASAEEGKFWNGISLTGSRRASLQNVFIRDALIGLDVENGSVELTDAEIIGCQNIGLYAHASSINAQWSTIKGNSSVGLWASSGAYVNFEGVTLSDNGVGIVAGDKSKLHLVNGSSSNNVYAIVNHEGGNIRQSHFRVEGNRVGYVAEEVPPDDFKKLIFHNQQNYSNDLKAPLALIPDEPINPVADNFYATPSPKSAVQDSAWKVGGNVSLLVGYHHVMMQENETDESYVMNSDTVAPGSEYNNYFQIPGFFAEWNAYLVMESVSGQTLELSANLVGNEWNHLDPENLLIAYTDKHQRLALGDNYLSAGETYMSGINILGASYDLNLFRNAVDDPLFVISGFVGESQKPKQLGERNEDVYKDYIDDGEVEPQEIVVGAKVRWNMHRRFNGTLGFIGSKDYLEDPIFRSSMSDDVNTSSPVTSSKTFFADGNWLFFPGDVELNGQVALGSADTSNVRLQRAINQVFVGAGLDASDFSTLRKLMKKPALISSMTREELEAIFGDNSMKTPAEMRSELRALLNRAKSLQETFESEEEDSEDIRSWDGQNYAFRGSLRWDLGKTVIAGHVQFVGASFYSAGSPDLTQNSRDVGGTLDREMSDFWKLNFGYNFKVENAAHGTRYNIFGLAEGEQVGIIPGADEDWLRKHEQDDARTLYDHNINLNNRLKIGKNFEVALGYKLNYRNRSTKQRLYANYSSLSGIYDDDWFRPHGKSVIDIVREDDTLQVDSARWAEYYALSDNPYLATQFYERLLKHTFNLDVKMKMPKNVLTLGGTWTYRTDLSRFEQDDALDGFDFSDKTYGILGYYFHGSDYFEQTYRASLLTTVGGLRNMISFSPRIKQYNVANMRDVEWTLNESMSIPLSKNFIDFIVEGHVRQEFLSRDQDDETIEEQEMDLEAAGTVRFYHTQNLSSDWTGGAYFNYRPDSKADDYRDIYLMMTVNYTF